MVQCTQMIWNTDWVLHGCFLKPNGILPKWASVLSRANPDIRYYQHFHIFIFIHLQPDDFVSCLFGMHWSVSVLLRHQQQGGASLTPSLKLRELVASSFVCCVCSETLCCSPCCTIYHVLPFHTLPDWRITTNYRLYPNDPAILLCSVMLVLGALAGCEMFLNKWVYVRIKKDILSTNFLLNETRYFSCYHDVFSHYYYYIN